jgi:hypothetical protein
MVRIGLWFGYVIVAFVIAIGFSGTGHGSFAPPAVLAAWGSLPWALLEQSHRAGGVVGLGAYCYGPVVYFLLLFLGSAWLVRRRGVRAYGIVPGFHALGVIAPACLVGHGHLATPGLVVMSYLVSATAVVMFFALDRALLTRQESERSEDEIQH